MPVAHLQIKYKASAARMSEATSGFRCASDPTCRCAHAGYAFAGESTATVRAPAASMSLPIPVTAIDIGEPVGDEGYLGISVGQAGTGIFGSDVGIRPARPHHTDAQRSIRPAMMIARSHLSEPANRPALRSNEGVIILGTPAAQGWRLEPR